MYEIKGFVVIFCVNFIVKLFNFFIGIILYINFNFFVFFVFIGWLVVVNFIVWGILIVLDNKYVLLVLGISLRFIKVRINFVLFEYIIKFFLSVRLIFVFVVVL